MPKASFKELITREKKAHRATIDKFKNLHKILKEILKVFI